MPATAAPGPPPAARSSPGRSSRAGPGGSRPPDHTLPAPDADAADTLPPLRLARITVFPVKSLDGVDVEAAAALPSGALAWDRRFRLVGDDGQTVHGKREPRIHAVGAAFDLSGETVTLGPRDPEDPAGRPRRGSPTFSLGDDRDELVAMLGRLLARPVRLEEDPKRGFPDDRGSPGPTVVSTASLAAVGDWFDLPLPEVRRRFRTNLEISAQGTGRAEPFLEDHFVPEPGHEVEFWAGEGRFVGTGACARCVVPSRDSLTGAVTPRFPKIFADRRRKTLPDYAPAARFDHTFRLAVNTRPLGRSRGGGTGGVVRVGDSVRLIGPRPEYAHEPAQEWAGVVDNAHNGEAGATIMPLRRTDADDITDAEIVE